MAVDPLSDALRADDGRPTTAIYTDEMSPEVNAAQYEAGNGPCLEAWRRKCVVRIDDMRKGLEDYPEFAQSALDHGVLSTLSLPLIVADRGVGAMNLYARVENGFSEEDESLGSELATTAAVVMSNAEAYWRVYELNENLAEAMNWRGSGPVTVVALSRCRSGACYSWLFESQTLMTASPGRST